MSCSSPLSDTVEISTDMANDETTVDDCLSTTDESQQEASGGESSSGGDPTLLRVYVGKMTGHQCLSMHVWMSKTRITQAKCLFQRRLEHGPFVLPSDTCDSVCLRSNF